MTIRIGALALDERHTVVREAYEQVGGRNTRLITITGMIRGVADRATLEAALDDVMKVVSADSPVYLSLRSGRRLLARREGFSREVNGTQRTGAYTIELRAEEAWEEAEIATTVGWSIDAPGATLSLENGGTLPTFPVVTLDTLGTVVAPALSDGVRTLAYGGEIEGGATLIVDGVAGQVWLDDLDITPYTTGDFPVLAPGETVLTYTDGLGSSHLLDGEVTFRDRWW